MTSEQGCGAQAIADWALSIRSGDVPAACINQAKLLLLDSIGCAIAGREEDVCKGVIAVSKESRGPCTIIGEPQGFDFARAVLANGGPIRTLPAERQP